MLSHPKVFLLPGRLILSSAIVGLIESLCCVVLRPPLEILVTVCTLGTHVTALLVRGALVKGARAHASCDVGALGPFALIVLAGFAV